MTLDVTGVASNGLRVVLRSNGFRSGSSATLEIGEDGLFDFGGDLLCGSHYSLEVEAEPKGQDCRLVSDEGRAGPDRVHGLECFAEPATCEKLFVEPEQLAEFEDALEPLPLKKDVDLVLTSLIPSPGEPGVWYAATREGGVFRLSDGDWREVLDVRSQVDASGEDGFLSIALAPGFPEDPRLFTHYIVDEPDPKRIRIARFLLDGAGPEFDKDSELPILEVRKTPRLYSHAGGTVRFGPDGMLWGTIGDGGVTQHPPNNAQDVSTLLGTMYRVDVSGEEPYEIPPDNPFAEEGEMPGEGAPEIWAWGLRNPYRWAFDPLTGDAWGGDVGQERWEEVNHYEKGHNYGWPVREGPTCFSTQLDNCEKEGFTFPAYAYTWQSGSAVIGGEFYRGSELSALYGSYLFADFGTSKVFALLDPYGTADVVEVGQLPMVPTTFATDPDGEILIAGANGRIVRMRAPSGGEALPESIADTGCVQQDAPLELTSEFIPYDVASPLWSDGATKRRYVALPPDSQATVEADGDLSLPVGSVVSKDFSVDGQLLETRFLLHRTPKQWVGYSYRWNEAGTEATLVTTGTEVDLGTQHWFFPGPSDCTACHTDAAGRTLGLELAQLTRVVETDAGDTVAQAELLEEQGLFTLPEDPPAGFPALTDDTAPLDQRVRAYLHSNCAHCHRPGNPIRAEIDLRFETPLADTGVCGPPRLGDFDIADAQILAPGAPERSVLLHRMRSLGPERMPRLASLVVDDTATDLVEQWIQGLDACE